MLDRAVTPLLHRVASGDKAAVRDCLAQYGGLVWSLARRMAPSDTEDAVQEIFVDLWQSAARYDANVSSEATFVGMIARRRLIDRARRRQRRPDTEPLPESSRRGEAPRQELGIEAQQAARAVASLRPEQQQVILLTACHGLSHEEVATATGMPLGTVKAHARRGMIRVREVLAERAAPTLVVAGETAR
jgi:RNA polymerase sigma-70 factor (ECF subfamily)